MRRPRWLLAGLALALAVAGCGGLGASPTPVPDPSAPCHGADVQRASGFYPALESLLPATLGGKAPETRDSGRYCSAATLGTLQKAGIQELRFAGAVWPATDSTGISLAVYQAPGLTASAMADSFTASADAAQNITQLTTRALTVAGRAGIRIDAANGDGHQVIVLWPGSTPDTVDALLASDVSEGQISTALTAFSSR